MARSIATRTGDDGTTQLLYGQRVPKHHPQIAAVGRFDEVNVSLGAIKPLLGESPRDRELHALLEMLQRALVALMGELACAEADAERYATSRFERLTAEHVQRVDTALAALEARGLEFSGWATPGANARASACEFARVATRRAERSLVALPTHGRTVRPELLQFTNRLSDLLWLLAREAEQPR